MRVQKEHLHPSPRDRIQVRQIMQPEIRAQHKHDLTTQAGRPGKNHESMDGGEAGVP